MRDQLLLFFGVDEALLEPGVRQPTQGERYVAGIESDDNGGTIGIAVIHAPSKEMVTIRKMTNASWFLRESLIREVYEIWKPVAMWAGYPAMPKYRVEALQSEGVPVKSFHITARSKLMLLENLASAIEGREIGLLPDERLLDDLYGYQVDVTKHGVEYKPRSGQKDNLVIATALALHRAQGGLSVDFV